MISISQHQEDSLMDESFLGKLGPNTNTIAHQHDRYHSIELIKSTELNLIDNLNNQSAEKMLLSAGLRNNLNNSSTLQQEKQEEPMSKILSKRDVIVDQGDQDLKLSIDSVASNNNIQAANPMYMYKTVKASESSRQRLAII